MFRDVRRICLCLLVALIAQPAAAAPPDLVALMARLPEDIAKRVASKPDRFRDLALKVIWSSGQGGVLTQSDLDRRAALDRAYFRARALQPLLEADLDNDGAVTMEEAAARAADLGMMARANLMLVATGADTDHDGTASADELRSHAEAAAAKAGTGADATLTAALMGFDADADGKLAVSEVEAIATALAEAG